MKKILYSVVIIATLATISLVFTTPVTGGIPNECEDTDGGFVVTVKGTISGFCRNQLFVYTDYCLTNTTTLKEYYCDGVRPMSSNYDCISMNKTCYDGACV